jgi:hypothetical protein
VDWPPYRVALRLYAVAAERWAELDADYIAVDLIRLPPHRFLNCVYKWCLDRIDPEKVEDWEMMLSAPLPGEKPAKPTESELEAEGAAFMQMMQIEQARKAQGG